MVHFVGAGPGAADLITVRGMELLKKADVIIYAGSLVNPGLLLYAKEDARIFDSSLMTLEEVTEEMLAANAAGEEVVRLHTGEPSLYGAVREQMDVLDENSVPYDSCPGVSACFGAASSMNLEYTLPGISQTLIITRIAGRTGVPEKEKLSELASHGASMAIYLSTGMPEEVAAELKRGGYRDDTGAAIVYKATWEEEMILPCTVSTLAETAEAHGITKTAVILVGDAIVQSGYQRSKLYDPSFSTGFRKGNAKERS